MMDFIVEHKRYFVTAAVGLAVSLLICLSRNIFGAETVADVVTILSDAFFVPGTLLVCVGLFIIAVNEGIFNALSYGMKVLGRSFFAKKDEQLMNEKYHEYHARVSQKKLALSHFMIVGAINIVISIIFVVIYMFV